MVWVVYEIAGGASAIVDLSFFFKDMMGDL